MEQELDISGNRSKTPQDFCGAGEDELEESCGN